MPRTASPTPSTAGPTRRAVLVLGSVAVAGIGSGALAGCADLAHPLHGSPTATDADSVVADQAGLALRAALEQVRRTLGRHAGLRASLGPVLALHTAHLDALRLPAPTPTPAASGTPTPTGSPSASPGSAAPPVPSRPADALASVADGERALHARLTGLAQDARSGDLARLLGAMAAGTSQRLAGWPA